MHVLGNLDIVLSATWSQFPCSYIIIHRKHQQLQDILLDLSSSKICVHYE